MTELRQYVDVCISNEADAKDVFGVEAEGSDVIGGKLNLEGYESVANQLMKRFDFEKVAITLRTSLSASDNDRAGMLYDGQKFYLSRENIIFTLSTGWAAATASAATRFTRCLVERTIRRPSSLLRQLPHSSILWRVTLTA